MRFLFLLMLLVAVSAPAQQQATVDRTKDSASGGATAPSPSFRRDASASRALFDRLDKNRDGYLTGGELTSMEALTSNWISVDRDSDGRIARSEFTTIESGEVALGREAPPQPTQRP